MLTLIQRIAWGLTLATVGLVVFGASVRVHGAGLACPDWPLCFGEVIPTIDFGVGLEWGHRVLAGGISLGFVALGGLIFALRRELPRFIPVLWGVAAMVLAVQIVLGGLTVLELLAEWTVTSHLLAGNAFAVLLFLLAISIHEARRGEVTDRAPVTATVRMGAVLIAVMVPLQIGLGGLVSSSYAGLTCPSFPACYGDVWFPTFAGPMGLQVMHRVGAWTLLGLATIQVVLTWQGSVRVARQSRILLLLVLAQGLVGALNVWWLLPVEVTLLHSLGANLIAIATAWLHYEVWRSPAVVRESSAPAPALPSAPAPEVA
ncbi:MAG: COX15/CtaA family protein [Myxococcota bacterium]